MPEVRRGQGEQGLFLVCGARANGRVQDLRLVQHEPGVSGGRQGWLRVRLRALIFCGQNLHFFCR